MGWIKQNKNKKGEVSFVFEFMFWVKSSKSPTKNAKQCWDTWTYQSKLQWDYQDEKLWWRKQRKEHEWLWNEDRNKVILRVLGFCDSCFCGRHYDIFWDTFHGIINQSNFLGRDGWRIFFELKSSDSFAGKSLCMEGLSFNS